MKVIAAIQADLETTPIGTRNRLAEEIGGAAILRRTVERIKKAKRIAEVYVLCPKEQHQRCASLLEGTGAILRSYEVAPAPWAPLVHAARKWSLDGWRGGVGGTTCFDEYTDCRLLSGLLKTVDADGVLSIPPGAPLVDPGLADLMIAQREQTDEMIRLVFAPAPPGIAGILLETPLVHELSEAHSPIGWVFSFKPDNPQKDLVFQSCCVEVPGDLRHAVGRLIADTDRSTGRIAALLGEVGEPDLAGIGRWLVDHEDRCVETLPHEVEIELTTDDPYPEAVLRPRGSRVERRGPIDIEIVRRIAMEICRFDDALVVLGGFGDPLRHPQFGSILAAIRETRADDRSVFGLAIRTPAVGMTDEHVTTLIENEVDILQVTLDAWTPELYARLQSRHDPEQARLDDVLAGLDRLAAARKERRSVRPITLPEMTKARDNVHEMDEFHDGWLRRIGAVSITGHSNFAGQCEDLSVIKMAPSSRIGCRRIRSRGVVLADGRVVSCDQDFAGICTLGKIPEQTLEEIWRGDEFERIRSAHRSGRFDPIPLCGVCDEWHRP